MSDRRGSNDICAKTARLNGALEAFWYLPCPHICRTASLHCAQSFGVYFQSSAHTLGQWSNMCEGICCSHCRRPHPLSRYHRCCRCRRCRRHRRCRRRQCRRHHTLTLASALTIAAASANVTAPLMLLLMVGCCVLCHSSPAALSAVQICQPPPLCGCWCQRRPLSPPSTTAIATTTVDDGNHQKPGVVVHR
jgi:hypothetical protein